MAAVFGRAAPAEKADSPEEIKTLLKSASQPKIETMVVKADTRSVARSAAATPDVEQPQPQQETRQQQPPVRVKALPAAPAAPAASSAPVPHWVLTTAYGLTNLSSVVMIVVANKMVLFTHKFGFAVTLTCLHALFTAVGMAAMAAAGLFEHKVGDCGVCRAFRRVSLRVVQVV